MEPVTLLPWSEDDFPVLERNNTPEMTAYLGGPESEQKLRDRQHKFERVWRSDDARMFTINVACARAGMRWEAEEDFEYPPGTPIRVNAWVIDLSEPTS